MKVTIGNFLLRRLQEAGIEAADALDLGPKIRVGTVQPLPHDMRRIPRVPRTRWTVLRLTEVPQQQRVRQRLLRPDVSECNVVFPIAGYVHQLALDRHRDPRRPARPIRVLQTVRVAGHPPSRPPLAHVAVAHAERPPNRRRPLPLREPQDYPRTLQQRVRCACPRSEPGQLAALSLGEAHGRR